MSDISSVGSAYGTHASSVTTDASAAADTTTGSAKISTDFQMFLKMLTAQMKNQDPLNPVDSTDYATQLATFSGVEQQVQTNELLGKLSAQLGLSGLGQFAGWVGMEARAPVSAVFDGATPVSLFPQPVADSDRAYLVAYDATGRETARQQLTSAAEPISWTGRSETGGMALPGTYSFKLESYSGDKLVANDPVELFSRIVEIQPGANGPVLLMAGGETLQPSDVMALRP